ncbi:MAG: ribbon-helix-helix domain-containing protein [Thermoplasmata archaeon]
METISIKLSKAQARLVDRFVRKKGFPSRSEFIRYAIMSALEEDLSVEVLEDIFESRRQFREGKTIPFEKLRAEQ